jgi:hypothetical protein
VLRKAGRYLAINPVYLLGMSPGATVETIRAAHRKASADGGGSLKDPRGGNTQTGYTYEQHAKVCGGRVSLHESAINIMFANWDALPRTWKPSGSHKPITRPQSYTDTKVFVQ